MKPLQTKTTHTSRTVRLLLFVLAPAWLSLAVAVVAAAAAAKDDSRATAAPPNDNNESSEYNVELVRRSVAELLDGFLSVPIATSQRMRLLLDAGFFPNDLGAADRDAALRFLYSEAIAYGVTASMGLETGMFLGLHGNGGSSFVSYREPGDSGYPVPPPEGNANANANTNGTILPGDKQKYWNACVDKATGEAQNCRMSNGTLYGKLSPTEILDECPSSSTTGDTSTSTALASPKRYCKRYTIETVKENEHLGHVPWYFYCMSDTGIPTEEPGARVLRIPGLNAPQRTSTKLDEDGSSGLLRGDCTFEDGTPVRMGHLVGDYYAYCGEDTDGKPRSCQTTYKGGYRSLAYDPRYRDWYTTTRNKQAPRWSDVFAAVPDLLYLKTYSAPLYRTDPSTGKSIFYGVLNTDIILDQINRVIVDEYRGSDILVAIVERKEPNKIVSISSRMGVTDVAICNNATDIPPNPDDCRLTVRGLRSDGTPEHAMDDLFREAFARYEERGFPDGGNERSEVFLTRCGSNSQSSTSCQAFSIQGTLYENAGDNLEWRILTLAPVRRDGGDFVGGSDPESTAIIVFASLGVVLCALMLFFCEQSKGKSRVMIAANLPFLRWILIGSCGINALMFLMLGDNTDSLCMGRMWALHMSIALTISPLFVKVYRIWWIIKSSEQFRRVSLSFKDTIPYMLPIVLVQACLLTVFSIYDPPSRTETFTYREGIIPEYHVVCEMSKHGSDTLFWACEGAYYTIVLGIGCVLAFLIRNLDAPFGEARQLLFALYNIAIISVLVGLLPHLLDVSPSTKRLVLVLGVLWGTVVSAGAFVLPSLLEDPGNRRVSAATQGKPRTGSDVSNSRTTRHSKIRRQFFSREIGTQTPGDGEDFVSGYEKTVWLAPESLFATDDGGGGLSSCMMDEDDIVTDDKNQSEEIVFHRDSEPSALTTESDPFSDIEATGVDDPNQDSNEKL